MTTQIDVESEPENEAGDTEAEATQDVKLEESQTTETSPEVSNEEERVQAEVDRLKAENRDVKQEKVSLKEQLSELTELVERFGGVDGLEALAELAPLADQIDVKEDGSIVPIGEFRDFTLQRLKQIVGNYEVRQAEADARLQQAQRHLAAVQHQLAVVEFQNSIITEAHKRDVLPSSLPDVSRRAFERFTPNGAEKAFDFDQWFADLRREVPQYFQPKHQTSAQSKANPYDGLTPAEYVKRRRQQLAKKL